MDKKATLSKEEQDWQDRQDIDALQRYYDIMKDTTRKDRVLKKLKEKEAALKGSIGSLQNKK